VLGCIDKNQEIGPDAHLRISSAINEGKINPSLFLSLHYMRPIIISVWKMNNCRSLNLTAAFHIFVGFMIFNSRMARVADVAFSVALKLNQLIAQIMGCFNNVIYALPLCRSNCRIKYGYHFVFSLIVIQPIRIACMILTFSSLLGNVV